MCFENRQQGWSSGTDEEASSGHSETRGRDSVISAEDPMGFAAAALYVACVMENDNKTQKDVAEAASVTEVTIRNRSKGLKAMLNI